MSRRRELEFARDVLVHFRREDATRTRAPEPSTATGWWPVAYQVWLDEDGQPEPEPAGASPLLAAYAVLHRHRT